MGICFGSSARCIGKALQLVAVHARATRSDHQDGVPTILRVGCEKLARRLFKDYNMRVSNLYNGLIRVIWCGAFA